MCCKLPTGCRRYGAVRLFSAQDKSSAALKPAKGAEVKANPRTDKLSEITPLPEVCSGLIPKVILILPRDKRAVAVPPQLLVLNQHDYGRDQIASAGRKPLWLTLPLCLLEDVAGPQCLSNECCCAIFTWSSSLAELLGNDVVNTVFV